MNTTTNVVDFPLDTPSQPISLVYRPWSTRALRLTMSTQKAMPPLRIRPSHIRPEEREQRLFRAFAADSDAIMITWGGGHESGPCIKAEDFLGAFEKCAPLLPGDEAIAFFNVSHLGPDVPNMATIEFEAFIEETGEVVAKRTVQLQKPADYRTEAVQMKATEPGRWRPVGRFLPLYEPRWWLQPIAYQAAESWPLQIQQANNSLVVQWNDNVIATIEDTSTPSLLTTPEMLSFELFDFDEWHVALRIWFFWLDAALGEDVVAPQHEVPDAERFDLLIRKADGGVSLACTDLHWRETWGIVTPDEALRASIGLNKDVVLKLAQEQLGKLWDTWRREEAAEHKRPYNPHTYIQRLAASIGQNKAGTVRGKGLEAHLPALHNVTQIVEDGKPPRMVSSDVRLG